MEGAGGIGAVNEMLLQSQTGTIVLFPQVPPGQPASFRSLRARGGFLVSAALNASVRPSVRPSDPSDRACVRPRPFDLSCLSAYMSNTHTHTHTHTLDHHRYLCV